MVLLLDVERNASVARQGFKALAVVAPGYFGIVPSVVDIKEQAFVPLTNSRASASY